MKEERKERRDEREKAREERVTHQSMSLRLLCWAQGTRQSNTTTESALAGMNPNRKAFRLPQL